MRDGKIFTGYYKNWTKLSKEDQQAVIAERTRLGVVAEPRKKRFSGPKGMKKQIKALKKAAKASQWQIASLKRRIGEQPSSSSDSEESKSSSTDNNAGNAFGGRTEKARNKQNSSKTKKRKRGEWLLWLAQWLCISLASIFGLTHDMHCTIARVQTSLRRISKSQQKSHSVDAIHYGRIELDTHADTCVLGKNFTVLHYTGRECDVSPYTDAYEEMKNIPIVTGGTAWTSPVSGETFKLVIHEALWMPATMDDSLLNPNQLRAYGSTVQDNPYSDLPLSISNPDESIVLPLWAHNI